eukprot:Skav232349  [mRNA]  locus=scaffold2646:174347:199536:+ [translate_table: standard]
MSSVSALSCCAQVLVMTSRLTHRAVFEHFEANQYFGLHPGDVIFFDQPVLPILDMAGKLLPQSLGGEFAQSPGGTGAVLRALASSSALEQCRDRGVECLHICGTENLVARVCDPVFIGFCRHLDVDCAAKVAERSDINEDAELFVVRQSPVSTQDRWHGVAGVHGVASRGAPKELLQARNRSWPSESLSDLACQRALLAAASEIRQNQKLGPGPNGARAAVPGPPAVTTELQGMVGMVRWMVGVEVLVEK